MNNILDFLEARITEDEAQAKAAESATSKHWEHAGSILFQLASNAPSNADPLAIVEHHIQNDALPHIARQDPARALAECAAKRAIIKDASTYVDEYENESWRTNDDLTAGRVASRARFWREELLRHLATIYADHPDYREEWRPTN